MIYRSKHFTKCAWQRVLQQVNNRLHSYLHNESTTPNIRTDCPRDPIGLTW